MKYKKIDIKELINHIKAEPKYDLIRLPQNLLKAYECLFGIHVANIHNLEITAEQAATINMLIFSSLKCICYKTLMYGELPEKAPEGITQAEWNENTKQVLSKRLETLTPNEYRHYLEIAMHKAFYDRDAYLKENNTSTKRAKTINMPKINAIWCMPFQRKTQMRRWFKNQYGAMPEELKAAGVFYLVAQLMAIPRTEGIEYAGLAMEIEKLSADILKNRIYKLAAY